MNRPQVTMGNAWNAIIPLFIVNPDGSKSPLDATLIQGLNVLIYNGCEKVEGFTFIGVENSVVIHLPETLKEGSYSVTIEGTITENGMRYAHKYGFDIVKWNEQSNIEGLVSGLDVPLEDALFILATDAGDIPALEEQLRQKIAEAEAAKAEWQQKIEDLEDIAKESAATLNKEEILRAIGQIQQGATSVEVQAIIDRLKADLQGSDDTATLTTLKSLITALSPVVGAATAYNEGKPALAAAITAKGQATEPTATLAQMAEKVVLIQQETYELQGSELYEKQMFGAATDVSDPYVQEGSPLWNLYAVMAAIKSDGRFTNYGGILLAEYFKGYDTIELSSAGAGGGYLTSDGDYYTQDVVHTWHDKKDMKGNRWVAYFFANSGHNWDITNIDLCPRSIHIGRNVGTITSLVNGRISDIVVADGDYLVGFNSGTYTQNWGKNVILRNIGTITGRMSSNITSFGYLDCDTIAGNVFTDTTVKVVYLQPKSGVLTVNGNIGINAYIDTMLFNAKKITSTSTTNASTRIKNFIFFGLEETQFSKYGLGTGNSNQRYIYVGYDTNDKTKSVSFYFWAGDANIQDVELQNGWCKPITISRLTGIIENGTTNNITEHILKRLKQDEPLCGDGVTITLGATNLAKLTSEESVELLDQLTSIYGYTFA